MADMAHCIQLIFGEFEFCSPYDIFAAWTNTVLILYSPGDRTAVHHCSHQAQGLREVEVQDCHSVDCNCRY